MNSAFVGYDELSRSRRVLSTEAEGYNYGIDDGAEPKFGTPKILYLTP